MITLFYDSYSTFYAHSRRIMGETQWREAEASGYSFTSSRIAHLRRSFASSPDKTANCAGYSFRPKTTFSLNFLIEHFRSKQGYRNFRVHVLLFRINAQLNKRRRLVDQKRIERKILSTLLLILTKLGLSWCIFISRPNIYQPPFCPLSSRHACTPGPFRSLQGIYSFRKEFNVETKEFPIEIASCNYIKCYSPNVYLVLSLHEIMRYARNLDNLVIW